MANIKSNIKTKKQSDKKNAANSNKVFNLKKQIKVVRAKKDAKELNKLYKQADSLANKHVIHKNKASRIKSRNAKACKVAK